ncbi:MAG: hypothetical protein JST80_06845 [Bdellovibrionales bacterium]|nr:hypothetical protein [Bdellovibrionales bacterium]
MKNAKKVSSVYGVLMALALSGCFVSAPQQYFSSNYVCDALDGGHGSTIKGRLYYLNASQVGAGYSGIDDFLTRGTSPDVDFYLGQLNIPNHAFDKGFTTNGNSTLKDDRGNELIEYFGFHFTTRIRLPAGSAPKYMQFGLVSDDGARLIIHRKNPDGTVTRLTNVNNDGDHAAQMGCGTAPVLVTSTDDLEVEIDYYQGPRYHIMLALVWREWGSSGFNPNDNQCGQGGTSYWFDSTTNPPTPGAGWNDLMTRWNVVPSNVFIGTGFRPCG